MSRYLSSESEDYYPPHPRTRQHAQANDDRVYRLTQNLQDTTRNLKSLDHMLDDYTTIGGERRSAVDRIRGDLDRTYEDIRDERARANIIDRDYGSDSENYGSPSSSRHRRKRRSAVRFADDMNRELHGIHQSVRDLSSDQLKLEESFNKDSDRRDRFALQIVTTRKPNKEEHQNKRKKIHESDTRRSLQDIQSTLRGTAGMDPLSARVERRLQSIQNEIKSERLSLDHDRRSDDINQLSTELKNAISSAAATSSLDDKLRAHYLQSESVRHRVEGELDNVRRRLDQTEGSKAALQAQVEQLRSQLARAEHDRNRIKSDLDESRIEAEVKEQRRRRAAEDAKSSHIERELHEMKGQLARSVGAVTELEDLRRRLDKSERQRVQLSDHIETLAKDLDNRERQSARVITQLKDVSDKFEDCERQRTFMAQQVEDLSGKLRDTGRELEKTTQELRNTQIALQESEKKKDEFKGRAQETVRQWKAKVKSLERDLDRQKHGTGQMLARHEQLVKEVEGHKQHGNYHQMALEALKRELADALAVRAAQDEQLRLKDIEVNELKSLRMDLDREYRDSRTVAEKLESELNLVRAKASNLSDERRKFEDKLSAVEAAHMLAQSQAHALQDELKELSSVKANIAGQLAEAVAKNHDLQQTVVELEHREKAAREETDLYKQQLQSERHGLNSDYHSVKQQLNEAKVREAHMMQELNRKFRAHSAEQDATTQALKMELSEEKSNSKIANRNADRLKEELEILEKRFKMTEEENMSMRRKMDLVKNEFEAQSQLAEDDLNRVKRLEGQLTNAQMELEKLENQQINLIQEIAMEIDALVETASIDATSKCAPINGLAKNLAVTGSAFPSHLLTEIKNKIKWMRSELRERLVRERRLRQEFRAALSSSDADRKFLVAELARKDDELDDVVAEKQVIAMKEIQTKNAVEELEEHVLDLSDELVVRRLREEEQRRTFAREKQHIIEDMEDIIDAQKEKDKIEQRYKRLQDTLKSLHQDLKSDAGKRAKSPSRPSNGILRSSSPHASTRKRNNNHVRISPATPTKEFNQDDPVTPATTPPPLALSDDEFRSRFIPRTPQDVS